MSTTHTTDTDCTLDAADRLIAVRSPYGHLFAARHVNKRLAAQGWTALDATYSPERKIFLIAGRAYRINPDLSLALIRRAKVTA